MDCSVSFSKWFALMTPLEKFRLLCGETSTGMPRMRVVFSRFSAYCGLSTSTKKRPDRSGFMRVVSDVIPEMAFSMANGDIFKRG